MKGLLFMAMPCQLLTKNISIKYKQVFFGCRQIGLASYAFSSLMTMEVFVFVILALKLSNIILAT